MKSFSADQINKISFGVLCFIILTLIIAYLHFASKPHEKVNKNWYYLYLVLWLIF
jgi:hypothetical protein